LINPANAAIIAGATGYDISGISAETGLSVWQAKLLTGASDYVLGTDTYSLSDTIELLLPLGSAAAVVAHATSINVTDSASIAQLGLLAAADHTVALTYSSITDTPADLATFSDSIWTVDPLIHASTNITVDGQISAAELTAIQEVDTTGTITVSSLAVPNSYVVVTPTTPSWVISTGIAASVIDSASTNGHIIHLAAGATLNLTGVDSVNDIVFDNFTAGQLSVSHSGATVIFTDIANGQQIAAIAMDLTAPTQTITYSDSSHVHLTLIGSTLALGGVAISTVGAIV
jgi:hypothetical protein